MTIKADKIVYLDIITKCDNQVVDEYTEDNSFSYIHGHGNLIQGLEDYLDSKAIGFSGSIEIDAKDAFGEYHGDLSIVVDKKALSEDVVLEIGIQVETEGPEGIVHLYISQIEEDKVTLDANHPFAGKNLLFQMSVLDIRDAHEDEIKHGRPHPAGHNIMVEDSSWVDSSLNQT